MRIESDNRCDALDLLHRLHGRHTYLVQLGDRRWHVCVRSGADEALLTDLLRTASEWATERRVRSVVHIGDRSFPL